GPVRRGDDVYRRRAGHRGAAGACGMSSLPEVPPQVLDETERASVEELRALQTGRMAWTLNHAYAHVPHYRAAFDAAGVKPQEFKELADLKHFPFTAKKDLRDNYPFGMFAVPREQVAR